MANFLGLCFLLLVVLFPVFVAIPMLGAMALRAFLASRSTWIVTALLMPHMASKALDGMYDAAVAGNMSLTLVYLVAFAATVFGIRSIMKHALHK